METASASRIAAVAVQFICIQDTVPRYPNI